MSALLLTPPVKPWIAEVLPLPPLVVSNMATPEPTFKQTAHVPRPAIKALAPLPKRTRNQLQAIYDYPLAKWTHWSAALAPFRPAHEPIIEDDTRHWQEPERWADEVVLSFQAPDPAPFVPNTAPLVQAAKRKEDPMLIRVKSDCPDVHGKAPLAYVKDAADHAALMAAYKARVRGEPGAQDAWNAVSVGRCQGLTVEASLRRFGRKAVLS